MNQRPIAKIDNQTGQITRIKKPVRRKIKAINIKPAKSAGRPVEIIKPLRSREIPTLASSMSLLKSIGA